MEPGAQKAVVQQIAQMFSTGNVAAADAMFAPTYYDHQKPADWTLVGPDEFKQIVHTARTYLPNLQVTIADMIAEGDRVAARLIWNSYGATGKRIQRETLEILRFVENLVVEHWGAEAWRVESEYLNDTVLNTEAGA